MPKKQDPDDPIEWVDDEETIEDKLPDNWAGELRNQLRAIAKDRRESNRIARKTFL